MTKPYHITPEQALELANEVEAAGFDITVYQDGGVEGHTVEAFQAFANAALDKVLGELVGGICLKGKNDYPMATFNTTDLPVGTILYAPK